MSTLGDTFPKLLLRNYERWGGSRIALRKKEYGIWKEYTWKDCYQKVRAVFLGLVGMGLEAGNGVAILGYSSPEWFWCELAVQAARGVVAGLDPGGTPEETKGLATLSRARFALAEDQEQVDKLLEIKDELSGLQKIVYWNDKGLRHYSNPALVSLAEVISVGEEHERKHPGDFERRVAHGREDDIAMLIFTLGHDDSFKIVPATHKFLVSSVQAAMSCAPVLDGDEYVSAIPPGWFFEQTLGFGACLVAGRRLNFVEKQETAPEDMREIAPHSLAYPPQVWDDIAEAIQKNVRGGTRLKKAMFNRSLAIGYDVIDRAAVGQPPAWHKRTLRYLADLAVLAPLRDKHGLVRTRVAFAAGGTLSPETLRFYRAIGVNLKHIYGSTREGIVTLDPGADRIS